MVDNKTTVNIKAIFLTVRASSLFRNFMINDKIGKLEFWYNKIDF